MASDSVNLVDKNNARRILLALLEQITHAAGADADKHFDEIRARDREERDVSFAGNRSSEQGFAGSRRPNQQHSLRNSAAEFLELLSLTQELDNLSEFFFSLFDAGHIFERNFFLLHREQARPALAKR